jgi:hypothetical protein
MTNDLFEFLARDSYPFVLSGLTKRSQFAWDPDFFMSYPELANQPCTVQYCKTGETYTSTVDDFFRTFGDESEDREVLRLKVSVKIYPCPVSADSMYAS